MVGMPVVHYTDLLVFELFKSRLWQWEEETGPCVLTAGCDLSGCWLTKVKLNF